MATEGSLKLLYYYSTSYTLLLLLPLLVPLVLSEGSM